MRTWEHALEIVSIVRTDAWMIRARRAKRQLLILCGAVSCACGSLLAQVPSLPPSVARPGTALVSFTYRSVLDSACVVRSAIFEKEVFIANIPAAARKQVFSLRLSGEDYLLSVLASPEGPETGIAGGSFGSLVWEANNGNLTLFNPRVNGRSAPVTATEVVTRLTANTLINLGVTEMVRGTAVWDKTGNQLVAESTFGGQIVVEFNADKGVPTRAVIKRGSPSEEFSYVLYSYDPRFLGGQFPAEFTRFRSGAPSEELGKMFTVRVKTLELGERPLAPETLDPRKAIAFKTTYFYSNDIMYWAGKSNRPQRVLTAEEARKSMPHQRSLASARYLVGLLLSITTICTVVFIVRLIRKTKNERENRQ